MPDFRGARTGDPLEERIARVLDVVGDRSA